MTITPERLAEFKKMQEEYKQWKSDLTENKKELFEKIIAQAGEALGKVKKTVVTVSTKEAYKDGNIWAISFGLSAEAEGDTQEIAVGIMDEFLTEVESNIGIQSSVKLEGSYKGKEMFLQFRKREK